MRRRSATYWERWCCRSWPAIGATLTSRRCAGMALTRACWGWSERRRGAPCLDAGAEVWLRRHLDETPLLGVPWILDVDATVKPLFGHQEGAGYNPHKPGRPSAHLLGGRLAPGPGCQGRQ